VQWVKNHWYNRNLIAGPQGEQWITVPVHVEHLAQKIRDVQINNADPTWRKRLLNSLRAAYGRAPHFDDYFPEIERLIAMPWERMAPLAQASLEFGFRALGRPVPLVRASDLGVDRADPVERVVALCQAVGADHYVSGPAAQAYMDARPLAEAGIALSWMEYGFPDYPQHRECRNRPLSILDLLFSVGPQAAAYVWPAPA
jgi:hypothetical protein